MGEKLLADVEPVDVFKTDFEDFTEGYTRVQIFNTNDTQLNLKCCQKCNLHQNRKKPILINMNKQRITVLGWS